jgi:hypothetical protein
LSEPPVHVSSGEVHAHPHRTGHSRLDLVIALSAIFISAISLFVAIEHGKTERDLVAANSWPFLREILSNDYDADHSAAIGLSNAGVGPAKVQSFEVFYRRRPVASNLDLLRQCCGLGASAADILRQLPRGLGYSVADETVLRPGEANAVMTIYPYPGEGNVSGRFKDALKDITFRACYCSVLDECWIGNLQSTHVRAVRVCPAPAVTFNPNER